MTDSPDSDYARLPLDYTASELREVERESIEQSRVLRRRSIASALLLSVIINLMAVGILLFATVSSPPPTPPMIVASAVPVPDGVPDLAPPEVPMDSSSPAVAGIESISVNLAMAASALSSLSLAPASVSMASDFTVGLQGLGPSFGSSSGFDNGMGRGGAGMGSMGKIGRLSVRAKKLGVVLDVSPSMGPHLPAVRREIRKSFRDAPTMGVNGCRLDWNPGMEQPNAPSTRRSLPTNKEHPAKSVFEAMQTLIIEEKVDAIYWFSDLQDGESPDGLKQLQKLFRMDSDPKNIVRLYIRSLERDPAPELNRIVRASGGDAEIGPMSKGKQ